MSHDRGLRLQNALARYLTTWWPSAESAGAGRPGSDVLGTPGLVWENKTAKQFRPLEFVRQARAHTARIVPNPSQPRYNQGVWDVDSIPVVVYWPEGVGEASVDATLSILPTGVLVRVLKEAGY